MQILQIIFNYSYNLLNNTYITFSPYRFSLFSIFVGGFAIVIVALFFRKFFDK